MTASQHPVDQIFSDALRQPAGTGRVAYLDLACGGDVDLRQRVDRLLRAYDDAASFLESPAIKPPGITSQALTERPGSQIGPYIVREQIGEGGMGEVYVAEQT